MGISEMATFSRHSLSTQPKGRQEKISLLYNNQFHKAVGTTAISPTTCGNVGKVMDALLQINKYICATIMEFLPGFSKLCSIHKIHLNVVNI
jgi:hypothetical protein